MAVLIGRNTRVEVQKTLASAITINAITNANPPLANYAGTLAEGNVLVLNDDLAGMTEVAGQVVRADNVSVSPSNFEFESMNSTSYGTFSTASTAQVVSAWSTLGTARNVNQGTASTNRLDATTLLDSVKKFVFGQSDQPEITIDGLSSPLSEALLIVEAAARANTALVFRLTMSDSSIRIFRGYVTLPTENVPLGDLVTMSFSVTQIGNRLAFAS